MGNDFCICNPEESLYEIRSGIDRNNLIVNKSKSNKRENIEREFYEKKSIRMLI